MNVLNFPDAATREAQESRETALILTADLLQRTSLKPWSEANDARLNTLARKIVAMTDQQRPN